MKNEVAIGMLSDLELDHDFKAEQIERLCQLSLKGEHLFFLGLHRVGKIKLATALARYVEKINRIWVIEDSSCQEGVLKSLEQANLAGANYVLLMEVSPSNLFWLITHYPNFCVMATLPVVNKAAFWLSLKTVSPALWQPVLEDSLVQIGFNQNKKAHIVEGDTLNIGVAKQNTILPDKQDFLFPKSWELDSKEHDPGWELENFKGGKL